MDPQTFRVEVPLLSRLLKRQMYPLYEAILSSGHFELVPRLGGSLLSPVSSSLIEAHLSVII